MAIEKYARSSCPDDKLTALQQIGQLTEYLPASVLRSLGAEGLRHPDFRIRAEMCHAIGRARVHSLMPELRQLQDDPNAWVGQQAKEALASLQGATPTLSDYEHLVKQVDRMVSRVEAGGDAVNRQFARALRQLSTAQPSDVQSIASSQISLLHSYYSSALTQARMSFFIAVAAAVIGIVFFVVSAALVMRSGVGTVAGIGTLAGALVEVISGINFVLYGKAVAQLDGFHHRLDQTQRFLLANSICESLDGDAKQKAREELVRTVATLRPQVDPPMARAKK
jgi:hypothetical protein